MQFSACANALQARGSRDGLRAGEGDWQQRGEYCIAMWGNVTKGEGRTSFGTMRPYMQTKRGSRDEVPKVVG